MRFAPPAAGFCATEPGEPTADTCWLVARWAAHPVFHVPLEQLERATSDGALGDESDAKGNGDDENPEPLRADQPTKKPLPVFDSLHEF